MREPLDDGLGLSLYIPARRSGDAIYVRVTNLWTAGRDFRQNSNLSKTGKSRDRRAFNGVEEAKLQNAVRPSGTNLFETKERCPNEPNDFCGKAPPQHLLARTR